MAIALGLASIHVVTENSDVYTYGYNNDGRLGIGSRENQLTPVLLSKEAVFGGREVVMILAGSQHTACVTVDGACWTWGRNPLVSQNGIPTANDLRMMRPSRLGPSHFGNSPVLMVACGSYFTVLLTTAGRVWNHGEGEHGELGHGDFQNKNTFTQVHPVHFGGDTIRITMIAAGKAHTLAIGNAGDFLFSWGDASSRNARSGSGALGQGDTQNPGIPRRIPPQTHNGMNVSYIAAGNDTSAVITVDGMLWSCGSNATGQLGHGGLAPTHYLTRVGGDEWFGPGGARTAAYGNMNMLILTHSKQVWICGMDSSSRPVRIPNAARTHAAAAGVEEFYNANIAAIAAGHRKFALVTEGGSLYTFGTAVLGGFGYAEFVSGLDHSIPRLVSKTQLGMARVGRWHRRYQDMAEAFAMGHHERLGADTLYHDADYVDLVMLMFGNMRIQPPRAARQGLRYLMGFD